MESTHTHKAQHSFVAYEARGQNHSKGRTAVNTVPTIMHLSDKMECFGSFHIDGTFGSDYTNWRKLLRQQAAHLSQLLCADRIKVSIFTRSRMMTLRLLFILSQIPVVQIGAHQRASND